MMPRLFVVNTWIAVLVSAAIAGLVLVLLAQLGAAREEVVHATRYAGQLDGQVSQCVNAARNMRDLHVDCTQRLERAKDRLAEVLDRCAR